MQRRLFETAPLYDDLDLPRTVSQGRDSEQTEQLARVRGKIGAAVLEFAKTRIESGRPAFCNTELHSYVLARTGVAPASPDRILRDLRQRGYFKYKCTDRAKSLYLFVGESNGSASIE